MMRPEDRAWMIDMRDYARAAQRILQRGTDEAIAADEVLYLALCRAVEIVGEAANQVDRATQAELPNLDWRGVIGMRHRLIHGYSGLAAPLFVRLSRANLPPLLAELDRILGA
jgi:uncharacterized protein with HEPN domain